MITGLAHKEVAVAGNFDIAQARAKVRLQLSAGAYPPMFIGRSAMVFTSLCELLFGINPDRAIVVYMDCEDHGISFSVRLLGAAALLCDLQKNTQTLQRVTEELRIVPDNGYLHITVRLGVAG